MTCWTSLMILLNIDSTSGTGLSFTVSTAVSIRWSTDCLISKSFDSERIKIIEKNKVRAEYIANELNYSIVINGKGLDEDVLTEANLEEIETVLALTNDDEDNVMACVLAEKSSSEKRTFALVNKSNYSLLQSSLKIDDLVDPRMITVSNVLKHVHKGTIETVYSLLDGEYEFIEAEIIETSESVSYTHLTLPTKA